MSHRHLQQSADSIRLVGCLTVRPLPGRLDDQLPDIQYGISPFAAQSIPAMTAAAHHAGPGNRRSGQIFAQLPLYRHNVM